MGSAAWHLRHLPRTEQFPMFSLRRLLTCHTLPVNFLFSFERWEREGGGPAVMKQCWQNSINKDFTLPKVYLWTPGVFKPWSFSSHSIVFKFAQSVGVPTALPALSVLAFSNKYICNLSSKDSPARISLREAAPPLLCSLLLLYCQLPYRRCFAGKSRIIISAVTPSQYSSLVMGRKVNLFCSAISRNCSICLYGAWRLNFVS